MTDLDRLIAAVEAGTATDVQFYTWRPDLTGTRKESAIVRGAYNGSLDAAKALKDALLPDARWYVGADQDGWPREFGAVVFASEKVAATAPPTQEPTDD